MARHEKLEVADKLTPNCAYELQGSENMDDTVCLYFLWTPETSSRDASGPVQKEGQSRQP